MKPETKLLLATAGVDIGMGALGLGLFLTLRVLRNDCYRPGFQLLRSDSLASPLVPRSGRLSYDSVRSFDTLRSIGRKSRWFGWAVDIWRVDVQTFQSSDVRHYLNFLRSMAILFARIAVLSLCVVLPVNLSGTGGGASISLLQQITPGNVIDDSGPGCYVLAGATVVAAYLGVHMASQLDQRIRLEAILGADSAHVNSRFCDMHEEMYTVMISGIDHSSDQHTFETSVFEAFRHAGAEVVWAHLVLNYAHVAAARRMLQSTYTKMLQKQHGVLAMKLNPRLTMVSLAPADQVAILQQTKDLDQAYSKKVREGTGVGFVCFSSPEAQMLALADRSWLKQGWRQEEAPAPRDIIWANLHVSRSSRRFRTVLLTTLMVVIVFLLTSSVFLTDYLLPVAVHLQHAARPVFSALKLSAVGFAPPAALLFVNAVILPNMISWAATHSHYWQQSHYNIHVLHANAVFQTMNTLVLPITGGLSLGTLGFLVYSTDPRNWGPTIVGAVASNSGSFAIRYLLNVLFISNVSQLVQLPQLVVKACCGLLNIPVPKGRFEFGFWFAFDLVLTFVGFFFAISAPLVPLFVSATLSCRFFIQKYNFAVGTWQISTDSKGALPRIAVKYLYAGAALCLSTTTCLFFLRLQHRRRGLYMTPEGATFILLFVLTVAAPFLCLDLVSDFFGRKVPTAPFLTDPRPATRGSLEAALKDSYTHPCETGLKQWKVRKNLTGVFV